jgi:hypothetical protein
MERSDPRQVDRTLSAWLPDLVDPTQRVGDLWLRLHPDLFAADIDETLTRARSFTGRHPLPAVDPDALRGLKFAEALPADLAVDTAARRVVDTVHADMILGREHRSAPSTRVLRIDLTPLRVRDRSTTCRCVKSAGGSAQPADMR